MINRKSAGITLVELLIVLSVLAIISGLGYSLYTGYVVKSRRADARIGLQQIALAQERYRSVNAIYTSDLRALKLKGALNANIDSEDSGQTVSGGGYYALSVVADEVSYALTASPVAGSSQAGDGDCTSLTLSHQGVHGGTGDAPGVCW
ncbi:MAG: type IV pilin protein [Sedimenticola sp.]